MRAYSIAAAITITTGAMLTGATTAQADPAPAACDDEVTFYAAGYPDADSTTAPDGTIPLTSPGGIFPWEAGGYDHGQQVGRDRTVEAVNTYAHACPDAPIHLHGHSYGAAYVGDAAVILDRGPYADRIDVHLTGDPRNPGGIEDTLAGVSAPGITMRGARPATGTIPVTEECHEFDGICHLPAPWTDPVGTLRSIGGYLTGQHTNY